MTEVIYCLFWIIRYRVHYILPFEEWFVVKIDKVRLGLHGETSYCQK